jgi:two-component system cell cycle response regulator
MRILVLCKDIADYSIIKQVLEHNGHEVVVVDNTEIAWDFLDGGQTRLAILDWPAKDQGTKGLIERIRSAKLASPTYIIVIANKGQDSEIAAVMKAGANDYLPRPISPQELKVRVGLGERILALEKDLSKTRDEFEHNGVYDGLTGLMNSRAFYKYAHGELERARRISSSISLIAIDIDNFKAINNQYGRNIGDEVIKAVAESICEKNRPYDEVGRWSGDEFMVILPGVVGNDAEKIAERILNGVRTVDVVASEGQHVDVHVSAGIASVYRVSASTELLDLLIQQADEALSRAKRAGGNQVQVTLS